MNPRRTALLMVLIAAGCATPTAPGPSLAPRRAEAIDPRVPIPSEVPAGPVDSTLASRLAQLVNEAQSGDAAFRDAVAAAERLAASASSRQSETWVAAQQALSAAQAARAPTARALADIDALAANSIASRGGIAPADLAAIQAAGAQVAGIDRAQAERIDALQRRLGS